MAFFDGLHSPVTSRFRIPGVVLAAGAFVGSLVAAGLAYEALRPHRYLLTLEASGECGAVYISAFADPVVTDHAADGQPITFTRNFTWMDGCEWQSVEQLSPAGNAYRYHYDERFVACPAGLTPSGITSPLDGFVRVERLASGQVQLTPLSARLGTVAFE